MERTEIEELINSTVSGLAARQEKQFAKMLQPVTETLSGFNTRFESLAQPQPTPEPTPTTPDPKIAVLERQLNEMKSHSEATEAKAQRAEQDSALSKVLNTFSFANDVSRDTAFKVFSSDVKRSADGSFVLGDEPLDVAVKGRMNQLTGLLAPKAVSGSGSGQQRATSGPAGLDQLIKPKMSKEEIAQAYVLLGH